MTNHRVADGDNLALILGGRLWPVAPAARQALAAMRLEHEARGARSMRRAMPEWALRST